MIVLKGAAVSARIKETVQTELEGWEGGAPQLAIIRVGGRPDDLSYERSAVKKLTGFGLRVKTAAFPADISHEEFRAAFLALNRDRDVNGILLLKPLPRQIDEKEIERLIDPGKDLDGICPMNLAKVFIGDPSGFAPCTAEAVVQILKFYKIPIEGKRVTIVGRSLVVGRPLSMLLLKENATITTCHTRTQELPLECRKAEILVAAAGKAKLLGADCVGAGAVVIDVGIHVDEDGAMCGDVDYEAIEGIAAMATPVPGGVGTVTTAVLGAHLLRAAVQQREAAEAQGSV